MKDAIITGLVAVIAFGAGVAYGIRSVFKLQGEAQGSAHFEDAGAETDEG